MSRIKTIAGVVILVLLAAACFSLVLERNTSNEATADFERVTGLYSGSGVRMLGIQIGKVTDVEPMGGFVRVKLSTTPSTGSRPTRWRRSSRRR